MNEVKLLPEQAVIITQALVDWNFKGGHISNINDLREITSGVPPFYGTASPTGRKGRYNVRLSCGCLPLCRTFGRTL